MSNITNGNLTLLDLESEAVLITKLVINVFIDGLLCLAGFIGNALILYTLYHEKNVNSNILFMKGNHNMLNLRMCANLC